MVQVTWNAFQDTTATSYNVYRSIPGITISFPNALASGDVFTFAATSLDVQNLTFGAVDAASVAAQINSGALGLIATVSTDTTEVFIRCTATTSPKLKLYPCTFLTHTGQTIRTVVPQLEWELVGSVNFLLNTYNYSYSDLDGTELDSYRITSVVGVTESLPSLIETPQIGTDTLCAIEGRVCDGQNKPVVNMLIKAAPRVPEAASDGHSIDVHGTEVYTDQYGRFSISLAQGVLYLFQIPNIGYNETITVPAQTSASLLDIIPTTAGRFSPCEDPQ